MYDVHDEESAKAEHRVSYLADVQAHVPQDPGTGHAESKVDNCGAGGE